MSDHDEIEVETAVDDLTAARRAVRDERRATERERRGFEQFRRTVVQTDAVTDVESSCFAGSPAPGWTTGAAAATASAPAADDRCRRVRAAFEEFVLPYAGTDRDTDADGVYATIAAELSSEVAVALASEGGGGFTEPLRSAILDHAEQRSTECRVMLRALDRELDSLDDAIETAKATAGSLPAVDESVLLLSEDDELRDRHRRVTSLETDLDAAIRARQRTLDQVTASEVKAGIGHDTVVEYLFGDCDTTYPALDALVRCARECRRRRDVLESALGDE